MIKNICRIKCNKYRKFQTPRKKPSLLFVISNGKDKKIFKEESVEVLKTLD